jgi:hypothetical protein
LPAMGPVNGERRSTECTGAREENRTPDLRITSVNGLQTSGI